VDPAALSEWLITNGLGKPRIADRQVAGGVATAVGNTGHMAYDDELADRIRAHVERESGLTEKKMFGGLAFLINGRMAVAAGSRGDVLLRCDPAETESLLREPHVGPFEMRGREMVGWLQLDANGLTDAELDKWIQRGVSYAKSLPPK
jgi:hypothetical protein